MTSETLHDLDPSFEWKPTYMAQLQHIADTDEFLHDDDQHLASSSSSSSPAAQALQHPGAYDWPVLKDAIKYRIRECLQQSFAGERVKDLHPAAALHSAAAKDDETKNESATETSANGSAISPADNQNFYPTKRPPSSLTFSSLTPAETTSHTRTLFSMLDDFDTQPPFTIQRLSELLIQPTAHYNSALKWIGAVKRCLSVTATRDAFPISPVQTPIGIQGANGIHEIEAEGSQTDLSEVDMDRMDGLPPSSVSGRSRSSSVSSNTNAAEPLFSPIPFVVRDENGQLTHAGGEADQQTEGAAGLMESIPDLELGGADRTHAGTTLPKEVVDVAPPAPTATATTEAAEQQDEAMPADKQDKAHAVSADEAGSVAAAVDAQPTAGDAATDPVQTTEPLGVPDGQVDELDNPSQTVLPLTSTTATDAAPTTEMSDTASQEEQDADTGRSTKRRKSVASIHDPRE